MRFFIVFIVSWTRMRDEFGKRVWQFPNLHSENDSLASTKFRNDPKLTPPSGQKLLLTITIFPTFFHFLTSEIHYDFKWLSMSTNDSK